MEDVCNISQQLEWTIRRGIWPGNKFPSFILNPITVLRFSLEFITYMPDATYLTHGIDTSRWQQRHHRRWYISWRATINSVVSFLYALGLKARSALFLVFRCRVSYELTEIPPLTITTCTIYTCWYHILSHEQQILRGRYGHFSLQDVGLVLVTKTCPHRPQAIKRAKNGETFP